MIIDGILGLKGPPSLTCKAWDACEAKVVTRGRQVAKLNNLCFAKPWGLTSPEGSHIDTGLPF